MALQYGLRLLADLASRGSSDGARLMILIFHRVLDKPDFMRPDEVYLEKFRWQMELLASHFKVFPLMQALELQARDELPARSVAITFDDGYADNLHNALPVLQEFGLPATVFVASDYLDGGAMWNDRIIEAIREVRAQEIDLEHLGLGKHSADSEQSRATTAVALLRLIKHREPDQRQALTNSIQDLVKGSTDLSRLMLTTNELRALGSSGLVEIGGHTCSHPILANLDNDASRAEIHDNKSRLEEKIDRELRLFAYPNGRAGADYQSKDVDLVREAGYQAAVSTHWGVADKRSDRFQLPRFTPWDATPWRFMLRLASTYRTTGSVAA